MVSSLGAHGNSCLEPVKGHLSRDMMVAKEPGVKVVILPDMVRFSETCRIRQEERLMQDKFGEAYREYKKSVQASRGCCDSTSMPEYSRTKDPG